jgi:hypothetical protein
LSLSPPLPSPAFILWALLCVLGLCPFFSALAPPALGASSTAGQNSFLLLYEELKTNPQLALVPHTQHMTSVAHHFQTTNVFLSSSSLALSVIACLGPQPGAPSHL